MINRKLSEYHFFVFLLSLVIFACTLMVAGALLTRILIIIGCGLLVTSYFLVKAQFSETAKSLAFYKVSSKHRHINYLAPEEILKTIRHHYELHGYKIISEKVIDKNVWQLSLQTGQTSLSLIYIHRKSPDVGEVRRYWKLLKDELLCIITSGRFTQDAFNFLKDKGLTNKMMNGEDLQDLYLEGLEESSIGTDQRRSEPEQHPKPPCPNCGSKMELHLSPGQARKWVCCSSPICKGTRRLSRYDKINL